MNVNFILIVTRYLVVINLLSLAVSFIIKKFYIVLALL